MSDSWTSLLKQPAQTVPFYQPVVTHPKVPMLPLGTPVRFSHYLRRNWKGSIKIWEPVPVGGTASDPQDYSVKYERPLFHSTEGHEWVDGIVVGHRTLADGKREWDGYDGDSGQYIFTATECYRAYLIAWDANRAIVRVKIEHVEALEDVL